MCLMIVPERMRFKFAYVNGTSNEGSGRFKHAFRAATLQVWMEPLDNNNGTVLAVLDEEL